MNGQFRDTGNIWLAIHMTKTNKATTKTNKQTKNTTQTKKITWP